MYILFPKIAILMCISSCMSDQSSALTSLYRHFYLVAMPSVPALHFISFLWYRHHSNISVTKDKEYNPMIVPTWLVKKVYSRILPCRHLFVLFCYFLPLTRLADLMAWIVVRISGAILECLSFSGPTVFKLQGSIHSPGCWARLVLLGHQKGLLWRITLFNRVLMHLYPFP